ncbi:YraN family protein [Rapidithrix thailandica]|uniref:UPF0102 protein AAG747_01535 n=1 Tax=Rapidithrix thailandica TaxID=413964 RepID=A0AAW9S2F4_9BACT
MIGKRGEEIACWYLKRRGFDILEQNYRYKKGEIDLIASKDNWLIFVEVRVRNNDAYGYPEQSISAQKEELLLATAEHYLHTHPNKHCQIRFDILSITLQANRSTVRHFEDAIG